MPAVAEPPVASREARWPETDLSLLEEGRPALPGFPLGALPPWWRAWVSETAQAIGAPADYVVQALLASVAGVCGAGVVARVTESWDEPLILWQVLVGGPSNGKTPALATLRRALAAVEKTTSRDGRGPVLVDQDLGLPRLLADARKRPAGALLWRDEPGAWLAALGGSLLDSWSPLRTVLGPGNPAISIIGCLDPARLAGTLRGCDDGRAARFLFTWPQAAPWRSFLERQPLRESDAVNALQRIARIAGDPAAPLALLLSEQALRAFDGHLAELHHEPPRAEGGEAAWLGKGASTIARLAAVLTLLGWAVNGSSVASPPAAITEETMCWACRLWDYFREHARAVLVRAAPSDGERLMRRVLSWIHARGVRQVSREDVRRDALGQALNANQSLKVIQSLERAGWLREVDVDYAGNGRPAQRWDVNPIVLDSGGAKTALSAKTPFAAHPCGETAKLRTGLLEP